MKDRLRQIIEKEFAETLDQALQLAEGPKPSEPIEFIVRVYPEAWTA